MNQLLLSPTDVLFFRDGRPIGGSLAGHGAAWPLPTVTNAALHAALWRSGLAEQAHVHRRARSGRLLSEDRERQGEKFGSLVTAGPFPVCTGGAAPTWFFPAPADAHCKPDRNPGGAQVGTGTVLEIVRPTAATPGSTSSNPLPLTAANLQPPTKDRLAPWWSEGAWNTYLGTVQRDPLAGRLFTKYDREFADDEAQIGIGIDAERGTQDGTRIYSAHYLRLREGWNLGLFAKTADKFADPDQRGRRDDLIPDLFRSGGQILVGGQQRLCTVERQSVAESQRLPLPLGMTSGFTVASIRLIDDPQPKHLVKWVLLSPAIFPELNTASPQHPGGWLPSWIHPASHAVLLRVPAPPRDPENQSRSTYRDLVQRQPFIAARLVAALVPKPLPVTGWSLGDERTGDEGQPLHTAGAKPTHLAVPAGAVYYFSCDSADAARDLAAALNWHGDTPGTTIRNRRSTLLGEKGFGLGVCGTWQPIRPNTA